MSNCSCLVALSLTLSVKPLAQAQTGQVIFAVDETQSQITLSGDIVAFSGFFAAPLSTQGPGSLVNAYSGNINTVVAGSAIQFTGSSTISAQTNGVWQPAPGGASGSGPANYGGQAQASIAFVGTVTAYAALRDVVFDVTSSLLSVTQTNFAASALVFSFSTNSSGTIDFRDNIGDVGSYPLIGDLANTASTNASLITTNGVQKLVIPLAVTYSVSSGALAGTTLYLAGQIVAAALPTIDSIVVTNHTAILTVANATLQPQVEGSTDLKTWLAVSATVTNASGKTLFATPITGQIEFLRVRR